MSLIVGGLIAAWAIYTFTHWYLPGRGLRYHSQRVQGKVSQNPLFESLLSLTTGLDHDTSHLDEESDDEGGVQRESGRRREGDPH